MCSSTNTPRNFVCLTSIVLPSIPVDASSVLYVVMLYDIVFLMFIGII